ncbi:MAG: magnesium transporter CorA family protein [Deltaproteobacteria bacterium]|nr:magnesium transporter CorA family protein [Kofleriaceae bacterium]
MLLERHTRWLDAVEPDEGEQATLHERGVPAAFVRHALDVAEQPRIQHDGAGASLVVFRVPEADGPGGKAIALAIVVRGEQIVTIASQRLALLDRVAPTDAGMVPAVWLPELVHAVVAAFDARLDTVDREVERLEQTLRTSQRNAEVLALLECQKALVHLERALAADVGLVERLRDDATLAFDPAARRRLDAALVELRQTLQMTTISAEILASMMDAFASIISNNLNHAMKLMAAVMIMLSIPTMVAGLWGMNVPLPGGGQPWAFAAIVAVLGLASLAVGLLFRRRRWL